MKQERKKRKKKKIVSKEHLRMTSFVQILNEKSSSCQTKDTMWISDVFVIVYIDIIFIMTKWQFFKINPKEWKCFVYKTTPFSLHYHGNRRNHSRGKCNFQANRMRSRYLYVIPKKGGSYVPAVSSSLTVIGRLVCNCRHDRIELKAGMYSPKTDGEILDSMYPEEEGKFAVAGWLENISKTSDIKSQIEEHERIRSRQIGRLADFFFLWTRTAYVQWKVANFSSSEIKVSNTYNRRN